MPWSIEKRDGKWCVIKDSDGTNEGCHDTEQEARDQQKALYADEPDASIRNAFSEGFASGLMRVPAEIASEIASVIDAAVGEATPEEPPTPGSRWRGVLAMVGSTDDGRYFEDVDWREVPLSFMVQIATSAGPHEGAQIGGRIDWIERRGRAVIGGGVFNEDEFGQYAAARCADRSLTGVSVDAVGAGEFRCTSYNTENPDDPYCENIVLAFPKATICAATQLATPAFAAAQIEMVPADETPEQASAALVRLQADAERLLPPDPTFPEPPAMVRDDEFLLAGSRLADPLVAMAGRPSEVRPPLEPPRAWFEVPEPDEYVPLHITAEGQILGHIGPHGECHTGYPGACVTIPPSPSGYAVFNLRRGGVVCDDGSEVRTGPVTLTTSHAGEHMDAGRALNHYDNSGCAVGDVVVREGMWGPWVCGAARPTVTPEQVREFNASAPSGDWRSVGGQLDLVAVLMVNTPGFPPLIASGVRMLEGGRYEQESLIVTGAPAGARVGDERDQRIAVLEARLARVELVTNAVFARMEPQLFEALEASLRGE